MLQILIDEGVITRLLKEDFLYEKHKVESILSLVLEDEAVKEGRIRY